MVRLNIKVYNLSVSAVEKGIAKLLADGKIEKFGKGKNTFYVKKLKSHISPLSQG